DMTTVQPRAGHVRRVENEFQTTITAQPRDGTQPAGVAAEPDEDHRPRPRGDARGNRFGIEAQVLVDVPEPRPEPLVENRVVRRHETQRRADDLVVFAPAETILEQ